MTRLTAIKVGIDQITKMADSVGQLDAQVFGVAAQTALNETVDRAYQLASDRITTGINLSDDYLRRRMTVEHASASKLEASITATGSRALLTRLATYDAAMIIVPRKTTRASRATGSLPIPIGMGAKQGGVRVTVTRGNTKALDMFMLPLRAGAVTGEKYGVFRREGGKLKHLFGPSVYQLFAYQAPRITDEVLDDLQQTLLVQVEQQVERIFQ